MKEPATGPIQHTKAIPPRINFQIREKLSIHQDGIAKNLRYAWRLRIARYRIVELTLQIEDAIENQQRDFILAPRQPQRIFKFIAHKNAPSNPAKTLSRFIPNGPDSATSEPRPWWELRTTLTAAAC
jgi:hypothetical protein